MLPNTLICIVISLLIRLTSQLSCTIYDYTKETLSCVQSCPSGSVLVDKNKCLRKDQYIVQGNVQLCSSSITSDDRLLCCQTDQFISQGECLGCNGNVFQYGLYCCSGSEYMTYASNAIGCTKIGTGDCSSSITLQSRFKVCCSSDQYYHIELNTCVSSSNYNCDTGLLVCCNVGKFLEYVHEAGTYKCVENCNWNRIDSLKCSQKYCNMYQSVIYASPSIRDLYSTPEINKSSNTQLTFGSQCCYGLSTANSCIKNYTANDCGKRFVNRGWSVCCAFGLYYSVQQKSCLETCAGFVVLDTICMTNSSYLQLSGTVGTSPTESTSSNCNGVTLPTSFPICCSKGFYFDGLQGCKYCSGTIHKLTMSQACCLPTEYFDKTQQKCKTCVGKLDKTGTLCCFQNQYFSFSLSGVNGCNSQCDLANVYQTSYCCESLSVASCQTTTFKASVCNDEYFIDGSCQVCPRFCSNVNSCTTGDVLKCTKVCKQNSVYFSDLDQCLSCDTSCNGCTAPFDNTACSLCAAGYVMQNKVCVKCGINCLTCSGSMSNCTSCDLNSPRPYYESNQCSRYCGIGSYDDTSQCKSCNFNCVQCQGSTESQCLKCSKGTYLSSTYSGSCQSCSGVCEQCLKSSSSCIMCKSEYKYYPNTKTCMTACESSQISFKFSNTSLEVCYPCHSSCKTCQLSPQNCYTCASNSQYIDSSLGVNLCMNCVSPCVLCISKDSCTSCITGYYLDVNTQKCLQCVSTCKTCHNGSDTGCLSCFGESQLISGKCVGCSSSCAKCDVNQNCVECNSGVYLYGGGCLTKCPNGYYGESKKCTICYSTCLTCSNGSENGCLTCAEKLQLVNGKCVGCSSNCLNCNTELTCAQCNAGLYLYQQNCLAECPKGTYISDVTCKSCVSNCTACASASTCTQCASGYPILYKGQCLVSCPDGYEQITNSNGCQLKNNTNGNNTNGNNTNGNNTNGNNTNGNNTNGNNTNNTTNTTTAVILFETFFYDSSTMIAYLNLYFSSSSTQQQINTLVSNFKMYLINLKTLKSIQVPTVVSSYDYKNNIVSIKAGSFSNITITDYDVVVTIVESAQTLSVSQTSMQVKADTQTISTTQSQTTIVYKKVSAQFYNQLIVGNYKTTPLQNIKAIGIFVSIMLLLYSNLAKLKSHFLAQEANALILHFINFAQVTYLFKYLKLDDNGLYGFLEGFGYSMLNFFPNFFAKTVPQDYAEITNKGSLVPDANLIRNAGFVFSYQLIVLLCLGIGSVISYVWWKHYKCEQMPQIRKVMRMGVFWFHIGFLPQLFFSFAQVIIPSKIQPEYEGFHTINAAFSYIMIFGLPILMSSIVYHFYATYNSDVLEHYYTLREGAQYVQIYLQALVMALSIDRPLIALCLIPIQLLWLGYNYMLYHYGEGYQILDCTKFIVSSGSISFAVFFLCLVQYITWEIIVTSLILAFLVSIVYGVYQVIGLYYFYLFKDKGAKYT